MCKQQQCFNNLNLKIITDSKRFWKTVKLLLSNRSRTEGNMIIHENNRIIKDNKKVSHTLNMYFTNLNKNPELKRTSPALKKKPLKQSHSSLKRDSNRGISPLNLRNF